MQERPTPERIEACAEAMRAGREAPLTFELAKMVAAALDAGEPTPRGPFGLPISTVHALATLQLTAVERDRALKLWHRRQESALHAEARDMRRGQREATTPTWRSRFRREADRLSRLAYGAGLAAAAPAATSAGTQPRARGAGRPARRRTTRPSARSGDSGEDGPGEPPPVAVRIAGEPSRESGDAVARYLERFLAAERHGTTWRTRP